MRRMLSWDHRRWHQRGWGQLEWCVTGTQGDHRVSMVRTSSTVTMLLSQDWRYTRRWNATQRLSAICRDYHHTIGPGWSTTSSRGSTTARWSCVLCLIVIWTVEDVAQEMAVAVECRFSFLFSFFKHNAKGNTQKGTSRVIHHFILR